VRGCSRLFPAGFATTAAAECAWVLWNTISMPGRGTTDQTTISGAFGRARTALLAAGRDASRLDGYTWHCNRHTFASRLVMAGVDLRSIQALGGWRTLAMVQRYSHLAPDHLQEAVERVPASVGRRPHPVYRKYLMRL
jgi:integrase